MAKRRPIPPGKRLVCRPWVRHPKTGKIIRPKNGRVFCWLEDDDPSSAGKA